MNQFKISKGDLDKLSIVIINQEKKISRELSSSLNRSISNNQIRVSHNNLFAFDQLKRHDEQQQQYSNSPNNFINNNASLSQNNNNNNSISQISHFPFLDQIHHNSEEDSKRTNLHKSNKSKKYNDKQNINLTKQNQNSSEFYENTHPINADKHTNILKTIENEYQFTTEQESHKETTSFKNSASPNIFRSKKGQEKSPKPRKSQNSILNKKLIYNNSPQLKKRTLVLQGKNNNNNNNNHNDDQIKNENGIEKTQVSFISQFLNKLQEKKNQLVVYFFVRQFMNKLLTKLSYKNYVFLQYKHYKAIDDKSIVLNQYSYNSDNLSSTVSYGSSYQLFLHNQKLQNTILDERRLLFYKNMDSTKRYQIKYILTKLQLKLYDYLMSCSLIQLKVLMPNGSFLLIWNSLMLIVQIFLFLVLPLKYSFRIKILDNYEWDLILYKIPIIVYIISLFLGFHEGYYEYGFPVLDKKKVAIFYIKNKLWIDLTCIILLSINIHQLQYILFLILQIKQVQFISHIQFIFIHYSIQKSYLILYQSKYKIKKVNQKLNLINDNLQLQERFPVLFDFSKLIVKVLYITHLFGCGFNLISWVTQNEHPGCWLMKVGLLNGDWIEQYVYSIYFSVITMITIGYGDIYPINIYEKIYVIIMTFFSCVLFAYCLNQIGEIFKDMKKKSREYNQEKYILSQYLKKMNISNHIQVKFFKYTEYMHNSLDSYQTKAQEIFNSCPLYLREKVKREYYGKILQNYKTFKVNFSMRFLSDLSLKMKEISWRPGEKISEVGKSLNNLYFIQSGELEYFFTNSTQVHKSVQDVPTKHGNIVLDFRLFASHQPCNVSIRAKTQTSAAYLTYEDFSEVINSFQNDKEQFQQMKEEFLISNCSFTTSCSLCGIFSHDISNCPTIHYQINSGIFPFKVFNNYNQERSKTNENNLNSRRKKFKTILNSINVNQQLRKVRLSNLKETHDIFQDNQILYEYQNYLTDKEFFLSSPCIQIKSELIKIDDVIHIQQSQIKNSSIYFTNSHHSNYQYQYTSESQTLSDDYQQIDNNGNSFSSQGQSFEKSFLSDKRKNESQNTSLRKKNKQKSLLNTKQKLNYDKLQYQKQFLKKQKENFIAEEDLSEDENNSILGIKQKPEDKQYIKPLQLSRMLNEEQNQKLERQQYNLIYSKEYDKTYNNSGKKILQESDSRINLRKDSDNNNYQLLQSINTLSQISKYNNNNESLSINRNSTIRDKRGSTKTSNELIFESNLNSLRRKSLKNQPSINSQSRHSIIKDNKRMSIALEPKRASHLPFLQTISKQYSASISNQQKDETIFVHPNNEILEIIPNQQQQQQQQQHLFGSLSFEFDKVKEYSIFQPQYNYTNVIKRIKKLQNFQQAYNSSYHRFSKKNKAF